MEASSLSLLKLKRVKQTKTEVVKWVIMIKKIHNAKTREEKYKEKQRSSRNGERLEDSSKRHKMKDKEKKKIY